MKNDNNKNPSSNQAEDDYEILAPTKNEQQAAEEKSNKSLSESFEHIEHESEKGEGIQNSYEVTPNANEIISLGNLEGYE